MSVNELAAIAFVRSAGNAVELARLRYALEGSVPPPEVRTQALADQREDGGWSPFWAPDYSSLDATCFRLAQAEQLGLTPADAAIQRALAFLARRQRQDGSWEEDAQMAEQAPPWVAPGALAACLYLSANCGYLLAIWGDGADGAEGADHARRAADYLHGYQEPDGSLPGSHTPSGCPAACGIAWDAKRTPRAPFARWRSNLADMPASSLASLFPHCCWLRDPQTTYSSSKPLDASRHCKSPDGRWSSEDGPTQDVHTTVEALRVLTLCHR